MTDLLFKTDLYQVHGRGGRGAPYIHAFIWLCGKPFKSYIKKEDGIIQIDGLAVKSKLPL